MAETIIYCYSGTGNCLDLAKNIAKELGDTDVVMMRKEPVITDARAYKKVGFVFPCYGGGAPSDVLKFAKQIQVSSIAYVFAISQSASYAGTGLHKLNKIHKLEYWRAVHHQCSCIWLFPHNMMVPPVGAKLAQKLSERVAKKIAKEIREEKKCFFRPLMNPLNAAENAGWPMISKLKAKKFKVSDACISCGQCEKLCPRGNIKLVGGKPQFGTDCAQCLGCLQYCPKGAISLGEITNKREHYHNVNVPATELMKEKFEF